MPVGDFSAAAKILPVKQELRRLFNEDIKNEEVTMPGVTLRAVSENHGMRASQLENEPCETIRAWWTQDCDYDAAYNAAVWDPAVVCGIPAGKADGAEFADYAPNVFIHDTRFVDDRECTSILAGANRSADRIFAAIKAIRKALATNVAAHLVANAKANTYSAGPGTIAGTVTNFTSAEFGDLKTLHTLELIAMKNKLGQRGQYWVINAIENFWELKEQARWGSEDRDPGDRSRVRSQGNMVWDLWLQEELGTTSTFLVNPNYMGMLNFAKYTPAPTKQNGRVPGSAASTDAQDVIEYSAWTVRDPLYSIRSTSPEGATTLRPIIYDVEYAKVCSSRDTNGNKLYKHTFFVTFSGGIYRAPANICGANSGILQFNQVP